MYVPSLPERRRELAATDQHVVQEARVATDRGSVGELIRQYDWPVEEALAVAWCESRHDPSAVSPDGQNLGLFQIHAPSHASKLRPDESLLDPVVNVRVAYEIWRDQSWAPWACKP